jgi:hypothetical protein
MADDNKGFYDNNNKVINKGTRESTLYSKFVTMFKVIRLLFWSSWLQSTLKICVSHIQPSSQAVCILQLFHLTTPYDCSNSQHSTVVVTHKILQLLQLTTSFSRSNSQHPSVVLTYNSLHQLYSVCFNHYMNILFLSRDLRRVAYCLGSSAVGSCPTPGLNIFLHFSFSCFPVYVEIMKEAKPFFHTSHQMFKDNIQKTSIRKFGP